MPTGISFIKKRQFYWQMIKGKNYNFVKFPISVHILVFLKDFVYLHCLTSEWMFFYVSIDIDIWSAMKSFTILSFFLCFEEKRSWECQYQDVNAVFRMLFGQFIFSCEELFHSEMKYSFKGCIKVLKAGWFSVYSCLTAWLTIKWEQCNILIDVKGVVNDLN